jgi:hypothetical protein
MILMNASHAEVGWPSGLGRRFQNSFYLDSRRYEGLSAMPHYILFIFVVGKVGQITIYL